MSRPSPPLLPPVLLVAGAAAIVATHPEPWSSWAVWALLPLGVYWLALVAGSGSRLNSLAALVYVVMFATAAALGDAGHTDGARAVYIFIPLFGLAAISISARFAPAVRAVRPRPAARASRRASTLAGVAVAAGWLAIAQATRPEVVVDEATGGPTPTTVVVRCAGDDTRVDTPEVRARADGIHVRLLNDSGREIELAYEVDSGNGGGGAESRAPGASSLVVPFAAETVGFACLDTRTDTSDYATVRVIDPGDRARDAQVACAEAETEPIEGEAGTDMLATARTLLRVRSVHRAGDRLVQAVSIPEFPAVLLLRGDRAVAMVSFQSVAVDRFAPIDITICPDA